MMAKQNPVHVENSCASLFFESNFSVTHFFLNQDSLMNRKFKRTAFIWNRFFCNNV